MPLASMAIPFICPRMLDEAYCCTIWNSWLLLALLVPARGTSTFVEPLRSTTRRLAVSARYRCGTLPTTAAEKLSAARSAVLATCKGTGPADVTAAELAGVGTGMVAVNAVPLPASGEANGEGTSTGDKVALELPTCRLTSEPFASSKNSI